MNEELNICAKHFAILIEQAKKNLDKEYYDLEEEIRKMKEKQDEITDDIDSLNEILEKFDEINIIKIDKGAE